MSNMDPGEGYRRLRVGEVVRSGDEYWYSGRGPWTPASVASLVGKSVHAYNVTVRRRVGAVPAIDPGEQPRPVTRCGCNQHDIDFGADPYAAHREWVHDQTGVKVEGIYSAETMRLYAELMDKKISQSRLTILGPDSTGDDIAADAPRRR